MDAVLRQMGGAPRKGALNESPASVILLHCSASSGRQWSRMTGLFEDRLAVETPDMAGHGEDASWIDAGQSVLAEDAVRVAALLDKRGGAHLIGHSYGGMVALMAACLRPARVRSLTLYEPVLFRHLFDDGRFPESSRSILGMACHLRRTLVAGAKAAAAGAFIDYWSGPGTFATMPVTRQEAIATRMPMVRAHFEALFSDTPDFGKIGHVPTLILSGSRSTAVGRDLAQVAMRKLPQAQHVECQGLDHMGPVSHPVDVGLLAARFILQHEHGADAGHARFRPARLEALAA